MLRIHGIGSSTLSIHNIEGHLCDQCDYGCAMLNDIKRHQLRAHGHTCDQCKYVGAKLQDLRNHQLEKRGIGK